MVEYVVIEYQAPCLLLSRRKCYLAERTLDCWTVDRKSISERVHPKGEESLTSDEWTSLASRKQQKI
jgi:hypothetical protein